VRALGVSGLVELAHTWSLSVEEQYYLVWPFLLLGLLALGLKQRPLAVVLAVAAIVAIIWRTEVGAHWSQMRTYNGFDTRADGLLMGCALAAAAEANLLDTAKWLRRALAIAGAGLIIELVHNPLFIQDVTHHAFIDNHAATGVATVAIIWALLVEGTAFPATLLAAWPLRSIGRISYGVYLYSLPAGLLIDRQLYKHVSEGVLLTLHLVATFGLATASYWTIERAFRRRRIQS
jgi:peptidoglycan/LPS O-acetylase OafA/YrhL